MLSWEPVAGVAEVMDMVGVLERDARMIDIVEAGLASGKLVSGHAFGLGGPELQGYLAAGITSDHECMSADDVVTRLRAGMTVELRGALEFMLPGVVDWLLQQPLLPTHLVTCTDDVFADTLQREGGVDRLLRQLIVLGLDPVMAIRLATLHGAYRLQRTDLGLVGAGRRADLVVLDDLRDVAVNEVFSGGELVARGGRLLTELPDPPSTPPLRTMQVATLEAADFVMRVSEPADGRLTMRTIDNPLFTQWGVVDVDVRDHQVTVPDGYLLQAAVHRYGRAPAKPQLALLGGWGSWTGAIATSVAHDTHNLVVFGRDPRDMAAAANAVIATDGGVAVAAAGGVLASIALPIAGILSPLAADEVAALQRALEAAALGVAEFSPMLAQPLLQVMVSSLACLPGPHLTDVGLVDGTTGTRVATALVAS
jgi:adenine deaminase